MRSCARTELRPDRLQDGPESAGPEAEASSPRAGGRCVCWGGGVRAATPSSSWSLRPHPASAGPEPPEAPGLSGLAQYCPQGGLSSGGRARGSPTAGRGPWKPPPGQLCSTPRVLVPSRCSSGAYPGPQRHLGDPSLCCLSPIPPAGRLG